LATLGTLAPLAKSQFDRLQTPGKRKILHVILLGQLVENRLARRPNRCFGQLHSTEVVDRCQDVRVERGDIGGHQSSSPCDQQSLVIRLERACRQMHTLRCVKHNRQDRLPDDLLGQPQNRTGQDQDQHRQHEDSCCSQRNHEPTRDRRQIATLTRVDEPAGRDQQQQGVQPQRTLEGDVSVRDVIDHLVGYTD
jgi:hypothetical protein